MNIFSILSFVCLSLLCSCNNDSNQPTTPSVTLTPTFHKATHYVDSFMLANKIRIEKSNAGKGLCESECTSNLMTLINKSGYYDDLPFKMVSSAMTSTGAVGVFMFYSPQYECRVQCTLNKQQVENLIEGNKYHIKFKLLRLNKGVIFPNSEDDKTILPSVDGQLISYSK